MAGSPHTHSVSLQQKHIFSETNHFSITQMVIRAEKRTDMCSSANKRPAAARRYLEGVEAGDDSAVLHMAAAWGVGELALGVGARAGASLELTTHFQGQPFGVPAHGHADGHEVSLAETRKTGGQTDGQTGWVTVM